MDRTGFVTLSEAAEIIGCAPINIINSPKYKPFYHPIKGKRGVKAFDINGYQKREDLRVEFIEKTKLFIEWLIHEKNIDATTISKMSGVARPQVYEHSLSVKSSYKIVKTFEPLLPDFDKYYGWPTKSTRARR